MAYRRAQSIGSQERDHICRSFKSRVLEVGRGGFVAHRCATLERTKQGGQSTGDMRHDLSPFWKDYLVHVSTSGKLHGPRIKEINEQLEDMHGKVLVRIKRWQPT